MIAALLGGVSTGQIARVLAVTVACVAACGSLGSTLALWREKTFQALAMTVLALVLWLAVGEIVAAGFLGNSLAGISAADWAAAVSPWRAVLAATHPSLHAVLPGAVPLFLVTAAVMTLLLNGLAIAMVRRWNPGGEASVGSRREDGPAGRRRGHARGRRHPRPAASGTIRSSGGRSAPGPTGGRCW